LAGKRFQQTPAWNTLSPLGYRHSAGIQVLVPWWYKCLNVSCDSAEVWCVSSATHMHLYVRVGIKSSVSDCPSTSPYFCKFVVASLNVIFL